MSTLLSRFLTSLQYVKFSNFGDGGKLEIIQKQIAWGGGSKYPDQITCDNKYFYKDVV